MSGPSKSLQLCVFISVKGDEACLGPSLQALRRQTLAPGFWEWSALCRSFAQRQALEKALRAIEKEAEGLPPSSPFAPRHVFRGPRMDELKNQALAAAAASYVFFMDEDLILPPNHLQNLLSLYQRSPQLSALGGGYISDQSLKFSGQVYNFVCNLWLKANPGFLIGGNMSFQTSKLPRKAPDMPRFKSFLHKGFGGEEAPFFLKLKKLGLEARMTAALSARHQPRRNLRDLISRAALHGRAMAFSPLPERGLLDSAGFYFKEQAPPGIKAAALAYLLLVRIVWLAACLKRRFVRPLKA